MLSVFPLVLRHEFNLFGLLFLLNFFRSGCILNHRGILSRFLLLNISLFKIWCRNLDVINDSTLLSVNLRLFILSHLGVKSRNVLTFVDERLSVDGNITLIFERTISELLIIWVDLVRVTINYNIIFRSHKGGNAGHGSGDDVIRQTP